MQAVLSATLQHAVAATDNSGARPGTAEYTATLTALKPVNLELRLVQCLDAIRSPQPTIRATLLPQST